MKSAALATVRRLLDKKRLDHSELAMVDTKKDRRGTANGEKAPQQRRRAASLRLLCFPQISSAAVSLRLDCCGGVDTTSSTKRWKLSRGNAR